MPLTRSRHLALAAVTTLGLGSATVVAAAPAHAADWTTIVALHKGKAQLCKEPAAGGWRVRIRLDNRASAHGHTANLSRNRSRVFSVRAQAGEVSKTKSVVVQRGDELSVGLAEPSGAGLGGSAQLSSVGRC
jgi:hypothetical protein